MNRLKTKYNYIDNLSDMLDDTAWNNIKYEFYKIDYLIREGIIYKICDFRKIKVLI